MPPAFLAENRHGTFYFRAVVPKRLRHHFPSNKREVRRSLQTDSKRIAIVRARALRVRFDKLIYKLMKDQGKDGPENLEIDDDGSLIVGWVKFCEIEMCQRRRESVPLRRSKSVPGGDEKRGRRPLF
ncbi:DUF6538 domain-containing protein [Methyloterricola oryzae]|uniref:DUF6538 domain-containing protein n=1 Tax=Methyloterricola oryzae TaxID=1495050 RepID=UPI0034DD2E77